MPIGTRSRRSIHGDAATHGTDGNPVTRDFSIANAPQVTFAPLTIMSGVTRVQSPEDPDFPPYPGIREKEYLVVEEQGDTPPTALASLFWAAGRRQELVLFKAEMQDLAHRLIGTVPRVMAQMSSE